MKPGLDRNWYGSFVEASRVLDDWQDEGFSFGVYQDPPGQEWNGFVHAADEYVVVAQGRLRIEIDGVKHDAGPGDRARIPAGAVHSLRTISPSGSVWYFGYGSAGERG